MTHAPASLSAIRASLDHPEWDDAEVVAERQADFTAAFCLDGVSGHRPVVEPADPTTGDPGATYCEKCEVRL
jgi:hypothetical protein